MKNTKSVLPIIFIITAISAAFTYRFTDTDLVKVLPDGTIQYKADDKGNTIPDFSNVGYHSAEKKYPVLPVVKTISPAASGSSQQIIQNAIDEVSAMKPDANGYRGTILLKKGTYIIPDSVRLTANGITLKGEGDKEDGTRLVAAGKGQRSLLIISGSGELNETPGSRVNITDNFVPVGTHSFNVTSASAFSPGDKIVVYRPGTQNWISDLKMDKIEARQGTVQWTPQAFGLNFERTVVAVKGNQIFIDAPIVMQMDKRYGGGQVFKYTFASRVNEVSVQDIYFESEFANDTDENHGWTAVEFTKAENCYVNHITSRYFGYSCVHVTGKSKYITVENSKCLDAKSQVTGGRRYSFNIDGQLNLVANCQTTEGRHDYVTGAKVCGPNVFYNSTAKNSHADIGPHHRWACGTLYDNIKTDGEINIQDRGNYGSGHGWSGVTQILWNCTAKAAVVQQPWVSGTNYSLGLTGKKADGRFKDRESGIWEAQNKILTPQSLYIAQLNARLKK